MLIPTFQPYCYSDIESARVNQKKEESMRQNVSFNCANREREKKRRSSSHYWYVKGFAYHTFIGRRAGDRLTVYECCAADAGWAIRFYFLYFCNTSFFVLIHRFDILRFSFCLKSGECLAFLIPDSAAAAATVAHHIRSACFNVNGKPDEGKICWQVVKPEQEYRDGTRESSNKDGGGCLYAIPRLELIRLSWSPVSCLEKYSGF